MTGVIFAMGMGNLVVLLPIFCLAMTTIRAQPTHALCLYPPALDVRTLLLQIMSVQMVSLAPIMTGVMFAMGMGNLAVLPPILRLAMTTIRAQLTHALCLYPPTLNANIPLLQIMSVQTVPLAPIMTGVMFVRGMGNLAVLPPILRLAMTTIHAQLTHALCLYPPMLDASTPLSQGMVAKPV